MDDFQDDKISGIRSALLRRLKERQNTKDAHFCIFLQVWMRMKSSDWGVCACDGRFAFVTSALLSRFHFPQHFPLSSASQMTCQSLPVVRTNRSQHPAVRFALCHLWWRNYVLPLCHPLHSPTLTVPPSPPPHPASHCLLSA